MPLVPTGNFTPTTLGAVARALADRLVSRGAGTDAQVLISALPLDDVPHLTGDFDVVLSFGDENPDVRMIDAAGRGVNRRVREGSVACRSRIQLDPLGQDALTLLPEDTGHFRLEDAVCDALELFQPTDPAGNWLVTEPVRLGRLGKVERERKQPDWVRSVWSFQASYVRTLTPEDS